MRLSRDTNGNKTLNITRDECGLGFSIQTLGNLPETHRMTTDDFSEAVALKELAAFVNQHGTAAQLDAVFTMTAGL